jgi:HEAT repeat protein
MGAASGQAALERLTRDADPAIRRQAAVALGRAGDPAALPALMRLLDDQGGVREAALASLAQIAGKDVARPDPTEPPANSLEQVRRWRAWYQARR